MKLLLYPFALIFEVIVWLKNILYKLEVLPSFSFHFPVINVGNLSMGGNGKTPHVEYIVKYLSGQQQVATLSRGYKRKSKGFLLADANSSVADIGDEPLQIWKKLKCVVAVDHNRVKGIRKLLSLFPKLGVIILDDAYQHRSLKPGLNILLTDYYHLYTRDYLLPAGSLREPSYASKRADIIIITKSPKIFSPIERRSLIEEIKPRPHQKLFFSYIKYSELIPLHDNIEQSSCNDICSILLVTGIANPTPLEEYLKRICFELFTVRFPDHHNYEVSDIERIKKEFFGIFRKNKIIVTTEKDSMRLLQPEVALLLEGIPIYYIIIDVAFHGNDEDDFQTELRKFIQLQSKEPETITGIFAQPNS